MRKGVQTAPGVARYRAALRAELPGVSNTDRSGEQHEPLGAIVAVIADLNPPDGCGDRPRWRHLAAEALRAPALTRFFGVAAGVCRCAVGIHGNNSAGRAAEGASVRPMIGRPNAPRVGEQQEVRAASLAAIVAPDPRAIGGDVPEGHDVDAQAVRAEAHPHFLEWRARIGHGDEWSRAYCVPAVTP